MSANVKINANSSEFNRQMAEMARELRQVKSSYSLANTQAKLFGSTTDVLKSNSTKLAKAGFAEAGQSLDLLTTIMNSYGLKAQDVTKVSDTLIQTQNLGKVTVGQLSADMGKVIPTAKSLGVNLEQVASGYAIMTSKGIKSAETTTYMNSIIFRLSFF